MCFNGRTGIVVVHSAACEEKLLIRLRSLCDAHLQLRVEKIGKKMANVLEITKAQNAELNQDNMVSFEVETNIGIHVLPMGRIRA